MNTSFFVVGMALAWLLAIGVEPIRALTSPSAVDASNGQGHGPRHGSEMARRR